MKRHLILYFIIIGLLWSCSYTLVPLKKDYAQEHRFLINKSYNETWERLVVYIGAKGWGTDILDKNSGVIKTGKIDFVKNCTFEREDGSLIDTSAYLVLARQENEQKWNSYAEPYRMFLHLNIQLRDRSNATEMVLSFSPYYVNFGSTIIRPESKTDKAKEFHAAVGSTGIFEDQFYDLVK